MKYSETVEKHFLKFSRKAQPSYSPISTATPSPRTESGPTQIIA
jgi:hypothetical protein